jgi:acetyl-CoA carboxylase biotin carboxyl carrier protein
MTMKAKEIQDLIDFISQSGLDEVNIETESFKLSVKKNSGMVARPVEMPQQQYLPPTNTTPAPQAQNQQQAPQPTAQTAKPDSNYVTVKSPMIGTFYRSPNPESPSFVNVGDTVAKGQPVCIIEAMKLFNEIESDHAGRIVKILVENASPVEYDQPLFLIDPA